MSNIELLKTNNATRWASAKLTRGPEFDPVAKRLVASKDRYKVMEARTGVPWFVIAVIHEREASQDWKANIANGQAFNRITTIVPKGRGPFASWEDAAYDALVNCAPYAGKNKDWSAGGALTLLEQYNGLGYFNGPVTKKNGVVIARYPSQPSPYIWSGTNQYQKGKYVSDGVFDPNAVDKQLGCAGLLMAMKSLDPSVDLTGKAAPDIPLPPDIEPVPQPASGGFFAALLSILQAIFKGAK